MKTLNNFKNVVTIWFLLFIFTTILPAQTPQYYNLNTGTSSNSFPFNMAAGKAVNSLFLAGEFSNPSPLPSGQQIIRVYFRTSSAGTRAYTNLHILLAQSTITTLTSGTFYTGPYDTVFVKDTSLTSTVGGWMCVTLRHPFVYDPTKSLIMFVGQCGYTGTGTSVYNSSLTGIRRVWSVGGCPFVAYASGDASTVNFGVDVIPATPPIPSAPTLISPANSSTGNQLNLNLVWSKPQNATNYHIILATDTAFTNILINDTTLTDSIKTVSGLSPLVFYYWKVRAGNSGGWSSFSGYYNFKTLGAPTQVVLYSPALGATDQPVNLTFTWFKAIDQTYKNIKKKNQYDNINNIGNYWFELSTSSTFTTVVVRDSTITDSIKAVSGLNNNITYYWRVKAKNEIGWGAFSTIWNFATIPSLPSAPILVSPPDYSGVQQPITFVWRKSNETLDKKFYRDKNKSDNLLTISKYWFEYTTDSTFATGVVRDTTLTDTTKILNGLTSGIPYYWRVRAKNQAGWGSFSVMWHFGVLPPAPIAPTLLLPANNATGVSLTPLLDWSDVAGALTYRVQVSSDSSFVSSQFDTSGVTVSQVTVPVSKLTGLIKYYWRVNATNSGGTSTWTTRWSFTTLQNLTLNLKVYLEGFWNGTSHIQDTVMIYLASAITPYAYEDTAKIILSTTGTSSITYSKAPNANYYIVVQHRNHLQTWSKLPQSFVTNIAVNYDFTLASTQAYGNNLKQVGTVWVVYGGDANKDGSIDAIDVSIFIPQFGTQGYLSCDFNGDGDVNASDVFIISQNFGITSVIPGLAPEPPELRMQKAEMKKKVLNNLYNRTKRNNNIINN